MRTSDTEKTTSAATATYYIRELATGTRVLRGDVLHTISHLTWGERSVLVTYEPCACHPGPAWSVSYSPIDLVNAIPTDPH